MTRTVTREKRSETKARRSSEEYEELAVTRKVSDETFARRTKVSKVQRETSAVTKERRRDIAKYQICSTRRNQDANSKEYKEPTVTLISRILKSATESTETFELEYEDVPLRCSLWRLLSGFKQRF